jgi:hypothetical protein
VDSIYRRALNLCFGRGNTVVVTPDIRRFFAFLSACGIAASVLVYIESFSGAAINNSWRWEILLGAGVVALGISIHILEYPSSNNRSFYWKGFERGIPRWVIRSNYLLMLIVIVHFAWYFLLGGFGMPTIKDGQYVLDNHGRILKVLTQAEYLSLNEAQLRIFATLMIACYFMPMMYWWFRRNH